MPICCPIWSILGIGDMESFEHLEERTEQFLSALEARKAYDQTLDGSLTDLEKTVEQLTDRNGAFKQQLLEARDENRRLSKENQTLNDDMQRHAEVREEIETELAQAKVDVKQLSELVASLMSAVEKVTAGATDDDRFNRVAAMTTTIKTALVGEEEAPSTEHIADAGSAVVEASSSVEPDDVVTSDETTTPDKPKDLDEEASSNVASLESFNPRKQVLESKTPRRNRNGAPERRRLGSTSSGPH